MELSDRYIDRIRTNLIDRNILEDCANEYGEPGYGNSMREVREVWLANWNGLKDRDRVCRALEDAGIELEWSDEWMVDYETGKAWRTQPDSYSWQPSVLWDGDGDYLTPDTDPETVIDWLLDDPTARCLPRTFHIDLAAHGFTRVDETYENGWHPGQTDDPVAIYAALMAEDESREVVFSLDATGQFDIRFSAWVRETETDGEDDDDE